MALIAIRGYYRGGQIVLEETPHGVDEAEVVVIFTEVENALPFTKAEREQLAQEFLQQMRNGFELGGSDYPKREEMYAERLERRERRDG